MKTSRKGTSCLNCGDQLSLNDNFCPHCGQKNDNQKVSFWHLLVEFLSNYFSLDSRLGQSLVPFLFQPGFLTNRFREGKRVHYVNPIRLYIILSVLYFFLVSLLVDQISNDVATKANEEDINLLKEELSNDPNLPDSLLNINYDTNSKIAIDIDSNSQFTFFDTDWQYYQDLKEKDLSIDQIYDSLGVAEKPFFEGLIVKQFVRIDQSDVENISAYLVKNLSIMMFILLPIVAFILKMVYIRRKNFYYFEHLIHSIHLHSFAYFIFSVVIMLNLLWTIQLIDIALIAFLIYLFFSLWRVYRQSLWKTFLKLFVIGFMYSMTFLIAFITEILISLLLF